VAYSIITAPAVSSDPDYSTWNAADVLLTNLDNDSAGILVEAGGALETTEAGGIAQFTIRLNSQPAADVTIGLSSSDASEGTVSPSTLTFTIANWNTPQTVTVTGQDDYQADGDVAYQIVTGPATSSDANYQGREADDLSVTNRDDDEAGLLIVAATPLTTSEAGQTASFSVALLSQPAAPVTVHISSNDSGEGTIGPGTLSFTASNWNVPQDVTVTGVDDAAIDGDISYTITVASTSDDPNYDALVYEDLQAVNLDNDTPGIVVTPTAGLETTEAGGTATFTVRLATQPTANVTIGLSSSDTSEGTVSPTSLTFTSADWNTPQVVTVTGVDDELIDGDAAYQVRVAVAASDDANYAGLAPVLVSTLNQDDDIPGIEIAVADGATTSEAGDVAVLSVVLAAKPSADVTVQLASSDETEGLLSASSLLFTPDNWNVAQTVTASGVDDAVVDGDVVYNVVATAVSGDPNYDGLAAEEFPLVNLENDSATLTVSAASTSLLEGTGPPNGFVTFDVELTGDVEGGFTLKYEVDDGTATAASGDYVDADGVIDFAGFDGEIHSISIEVNADDILEPDETFSVALAGLSNISPSAAANIAFAGAPLTFTILDDEAPTISLSDASFAEGTGAGTTTFVFPVEVSNPIQGGLRIRYTISDGTATLDDGDYVDDDGVLDIVGGVGEGKAIEVQVNRDAKVERDETFVVNIEEFIFLDPELAAIIEVEPASLTGTIINDDTATVSFVDSSSVAIETAGSHGVRIRLSVSGGGTLGEDVTLDVASLPGGTATTPDDFVLEDTAVTFPAGSADGDVALVEIGVVADDVVEGDETVTLALTMQGDGIDGAVSVTEPAQHEVVITEDPMTASVSGQVWLDANNNGRQDAGEIGIPGVDVVLSGKDRQGQSVTIVSMTDADGIYRFDGLPSGTYAVSETQPAALVDGIDSLGTVEGIAAGVSSNDEFSDLMLAPGQQAAAYNFGERGLANAPVSRRTFFASTPPLAQVIREVVARGEELAGNTVQAEAIRSGLATEVRRIGSQVTVTGSSGNDTIAVIPAGSSQSSSDSQHLIVVNGREWEFAAQDVDRIVVNVLDGDDVVEVHDSPGDDSLVASHDTAILTSDDLRIEAMSMELLRAFSTTGGKDEVSQDAIDFALQLEGAWAA
jgi:hypothetical protein